MNREYTAHGIREDLRRMQLDLTSRSSESRVKRDMLRCLMNEKRLDALYISKKDSFAWLTAGAGNGGVLSTDRGAAGILLTGEAQYVIASNIETPRLQEEEHLQELGFEIVSTPWTGRSDYETALSLAQSTHIYADAAPDRCQNINDSLISLRYSLTEREITRYASLGLLTSLILEQTMETLHPGMSELEVIATVSKNLWSAGIEPVNLLCAVDGRIEKYRHPSPTEKKLRNLCMVSVGARYAGLIVSLTRTVSFGRLPDMVQERKAATDTIFKEMIMNTSVKHPVSDILRAGMLAYEQAGYPQEFLRHHQGGAIGYLPREYKGTPTSEEIVQRNQGFCWNPTVHGIKTEDTVVVQETQSIPITRPVIFPCSVIGEGSSALQIPQIPEL